MADEIKTTSPIDGRLLTFEAHETFPIINLSKKEAAESEDRWRRKTCYKDSYIRIVRYVPSDLNKKIIDYLHDSNQKYWTTFYSSIHDCLIISGSNYPIEYISTEISIVGSTNVISDGSYSAYVGDIKDIDIHRCSRGNFYCSMMLLTHYDMNVI